MGDAKPETPAPGRERLADLLREAARNTAAMGTEPVLPSLEKPPLTKKKRRKKFRESYSQCR